MTKMVSELRKGDKVIVDPERRETTVLFVNFPSNGFISFGTTEPGEKGFVKMRETDLVEIPERTPRWWELPGFRSPENCAKCGFGYNEATGEREEECSMCYAAKWPTFEEAQKHACDGFDDLDMTLDLTEAV
ncbi:hypothetical protein FACS18949_13310 [Clostridia bacterium]|nr:hypothetical protein FACS189425_06980 [Clostridia bacterium]GHV35405.1 hypothetical protein FACS18949_13310 [Clostridia bacterium]